MSSDSSSVPTFLKGKRPGTAIISALNLSVCIDAVVAGFRPDGGEFQRTLSLTQDIARFENMSAEIGDVAMIVIDPAAAYLGGADTTDEAMAPPEDSEERTAVEDAVEFLRGLLVEGPVVSKQIRADAECAGFSRRSIQREQEVLEFQLVSQARPLCHRISVQMLGETMGHACASLAQTSCSDRRSMPTFDVTLDSTWIRHIARPSGRLRSLVHPRSQSG